MSRKLINDIDQMINPDELSHYKQEIDTFKKYNHIMWKILQF